MYLDTEQIMKRFHLKSKTTLYNWQSRPEHPFPKPRIGQRGAKNLYLEADVVAWESGL